MNHLFPNAIWFWTTKQTKSTVTIINDLYHYDVYCKVTGRKLESGDQKTLFKLTQGVKNGES